jgi:LmbE family N-acetylglucosaminyl deacetylase
MKAGVDAIYLSPHLDDVVLSCGGQIAARCGRGESVLVVTLAAGDAPGELTPLAGELHAAWGLDASCALRRDEDRLAVARLGADVRHEELPDAVYRRHPRTGEPLYPSLTAVFGTVHPDDPAEAAWMKALRALPPAGELVAPLAVGGHVDHQLARRAAAAVFGPAVWHYEDFPYAGKCLAVRRRVWPPWRWRVRRVRLTPPDVDARCVAAACYASQLAMLTGDGPSIEQRIRRQVRRTGGERLWRPR